ncbi:phage protein Gp36 family protein [Comamonas terrigena]|uniref:phage protein Gp36 family protein n=1 Tax=Comamonas terrigena TaxID=32013 RepID=UPI0028A76DCC|nr:phage protein Gp36 family protein [Comamonas terrigena]
MAYITTTELAERPGAREIAQVASLQHQMVNDYALMDATLRGADRSNWSQEQQDTADLALARVLDAVNESAAVIDGFLVQRGYALPLQLTPTSTGKSLLTAWSRAITRYLLNQNRVMDASKDPVVRDYQDAMRMLGLLAQGKLSLGAGDPEAAAAVGSTDVRFAGDAPTFGRQQLRAFR